MGRERARAGWLGAAWTALVLGGSAASAAALLQYRADLDGFQEPTSTGSAARGNALLRWDGSHLTYLVHVVGIQNVTRAALHYGARGEHGPVLVNFDDASAANQGAVLNLRGEIDVGDLEGPFARRPLGRLLTAIRAESTYVDVVTSSFTAGEVRGQFRNQ